MLKITPCLQRQSADITGTVRDTAAVDDMNISVKGESVVFISRNTADTAHAQ